jgi:hypothetical protein
MVNIFQLQDAPAYISVSEYIKITIWDPSTFQLQSSPAYMSVSEYVQLTVWDLNTFQNNYKNCRKLYKDFKGSTPLSVDYILPSNSELKNGWNHDYKLFWYIKYTKRNCG